MIRFTVKGDLSKTKRFLNKMKDQDYLKILDKYGQMGVNSLKEHTPVKTGKTANSWSYHIDKTRSSYTITWTNSNINQNVPIAIILQYGHGTGTGGYVEGIDYINPAMKPIFDSIAEAAWKEVTDA